MLPAPHPVRREVVRHQQLRRQHVDRRDAAAGARGARRVSGSAWYERVPQLSEDATANEKAAALIKKIGRRPGACMKQLDERPEVAPLSRAAVNWRDDVNAARAAHSEGRPTLLGRGTPPPPMSVVRQTLSYPSRIRCPRISDSGDDPVEVVAAGRVGCGAEAATRWPARGRRGRRGRALGRARQGRLDVGCACGVV